MFIDLIYHINLGIIIYDLLYLLIFLIHIWHKANYNNVNNEIKNYLNVLNISIIFYRNDEILNSLEKNLLIYYNFNLFKNKIFYFI